MKKIVVLNSGGFDSTFLLRYLSERKSVELHSLYFSYGQTNDYMTAERARTNAEKYCASHKVITISKIDWTSSEFYKEDFKSVNKKYLEARNLIFAAYATSYAESIGADAVSMALIKDGIDMYADASIRFVKRMDKVCREFGLSFEAPLIKYWKEDMFQVGAYYKIDPDSFCSCDVPVDGKPCGKCPDCEAIAEYKELYNEINF